MELNRSAWSGMDWADHTSLDQTPLGAPLGGSGEK